MFRHFFYARLEARINESYRKRLQDFGATAKGVFWRSKASQIARFDALLGSAQRLVKKNFSIADIGCGYGAMLDFIDSTPRYFGTSYEGVDINRSMIACCKQKFPSRSNLFSHGKKPTKVVDFCGFSGTFNLTHCTKANVWQDYIFENLENCMPYCRYGLIVNLICANEMNIHEGIFYANKTMFTKRAEFHFGRTIAMSTRHVSNDVTFLISAPKKID